MNKRLISLLFLLIPAWAGSTFVQAQARSELWTGYDLRVQTTGPKGTYGFFLTPSYRWTDHWSIGIPLGTDLSIEDTAVLSRDAMAGWTVHRIFEGGTFGIEQNFSVFATGTGRFDTGVTYQVDNQSRASYLRVGAGWSEPYGEKKGSFYLSAGIGIRFIFARKR